MFERFEKELNHGNVVSPMSFERVYQRIAFDVPIDIITPNRRCPDPDVDGIYHERIVKISSGALQSVASLIFTCSLRDMQANVSPSQEDFADDIRIPPDQFKNPRYTHSGNRPAHRPCPPFRMHSR